jgi:transposase
MRAYSVDLREKIVEAVGRGMPKMEVARTFGVGISTVKRYVNSAQEGGSLWPGKSPGKPRKLDESAMRLLEEDLHSRPEVNYTQRADYLSTIYGLGVSESTICRAIKRMGYTRKKDRWVQKSGMSL